MDIKFASDIIKLTFDESEPFAGSNVIMKGEALCSGFDAALSTMRWLPTKEKVSEIEKLTICEVIQKHNAESDYIIMFMEE